MTCSDLVFQKYIEVCNEALRCNEDRFPFKHILEAARNNKKGRVVEVCILDNDVRDSYALSIENGKLKMRAHSDCANCLCDAQWNVSKHYLKEVVSNPEIYIHNPAKIDWEWMYDIKR